MQNRTEQTKGQKAIAFWQGLSQKTKVLGLVGISICLLFSATASYSYQTAQFVDLYPLKLNEQDLTESSMVLTEMQIEHRIAPTGDSILLSPKEKFRARAHLASHSLPRNKPKQPEPTSSIPTADERSRAATRNLESELVATLRSIEEVNDARVKLATPKSSYFRDQEPVTASVFLKLKSGASIEKKTVQGIRSMVAHSVPRLDRENVSITDDMGFELSVIDTENVYEAQNRRERSLEERLQTALSCVYGKRVHTMVNLTLDTSQEEQRRYTPGAPKDDGLVRESSQRISEILKKGESDKEYEEKKVSENFRYAENYVAKLRQDPQVERITATVLVDGATEDEVVDIEGIVKAALGMDETRTDSVYVSGASWDRRVIDLWDKEPVLASDAEPSPGNAVLVWFASLGTFVFGCLLGLHFLNRRTNPVLSVETGGGTSQNTAGIVDHHHQKDGITVIQDAGTAVHGTRMEALEKLVGEQPQKVATLLRSTWLS